MDFKAILEHHLLDHVYARFPLWGISLPISLHSIMMFVAAALLVILGMRVRKPRGLVPHGLANGVESFIVYIRDEVVKPNLGEQTSRYLPYFLSLFFFILFCNLLGLVPFGATATGNIAVTATLALCTFFLIHLSGMREHGFFHYWKTYLPQEVNPVLGALIFFIDMMGLLTKTFALTIRLFANMIAGHIVILALISLIFLFGTVLVAPISIGAAIAISLLEVFVAFLQAYLFTFLTAIFVGMTLHPQH